MPTVSAAFGCSPTARVRRPQRDRKRSTCRTIDEDDHRHRDGALRQEHPEQPADERQVDEAGRRDERGELAPGRRGVLAEQQVEVAGQAERDDVDDRAADDLVGPDGDGQPGVHQRDEHPGGHRGQQPDQERRRGAEERRWASVE